MSGIISYAAYVPYYRLSRNAIKGAWGKGSGKGERSVANFDEDSITMAAAAGMDCLRGFPLDEVDGLYFASTTSPYAENQCAAHLVWVLGLRQDVMTADFSNTLRAGTTALKAAHDAVEAGAAKNVLVLAADCRLGTPSSEQEADFGDGAAAFLVGTEKEAATLLAWPYGLFDCCGVTDGAAAAILCRADLAKKFRDDPIYLKGIGLSVNPMLPHFEPEFDWTGFPMNREAARQAYEQAGIKDPRKEIDIAEVHDCFTGTELIIYEDLGFSNKGEGWKDVENGTFALEGELPVNTDGGLKAFGHPIGASGIRMTYEVYKQLQGKCGERQVKGAKTGLAHTLGGPPQVACVAVYGKDEG